MSKVNLIDRGKRDISMWAFESSIISRKIHRWGSEDSRNFATRGIAPITPLWIRPWFTRLTS